MLKSLRAVARFCHKTIGWNRIGLLLSVAIIAVAAVVLFRMLRDIDVDEVIAALKATELHTSPPRHFLSPAAISRSPSMTGLPCAPLGAPKFPIALPRLPASPATRSATIRRHRFHRRGFATASIRPTVSTPSRWQRFVSSPA